MPPPNLSTLRPLLKSLPSTPLALPIRPSNPTDFLLATLLCNSRTSTDPPLHLLLPPTSTLPFNPPNSQIHPVHTQNPDNLSAYARTALQAGISHFVLADTALARVESSLLKRQILSNQTVPKSLQLLPDGVMDFHRPLLHFPPTQLDQLSADFSLPTLHEKAKRKLFGDVDFAKLSTHALRIGNVLQDRHLMSDTLLRKLIIKASHWGYVAIRRKLLAEWYHGEGKYVALECLARIVTHVSGTECYAEDETLGRMAADLLKLEGRGKLVAMPKGRTVGGVVVRPATGRFARRLERGAGDGGEDRVMVMSREPAQESGGVKTKRLGGNWGCLPVVIGGKGIYWDGRFVIKVEKVGEVKEVDGMEVLMAALGEFDTELPDWENSDLLVRQMRRGDWEMVAREVGGAGKIVPYQCVRGLPAVFEMGKGGGDEIGRFIASPHLGICGRADLVFTAVRVPRYRCLPAAIEPGFCMQDFGGREEGHA